MKHQRRLGPSILAAILILIVIAVLTVSAAPPITESFRNGTADGWSFYGSAGLTSGGADPAGDGWLRLTDTGINQAGSAIYNTAFPSTDGTQITFQYATYDGTGADGISFYLIDGSVSPTVGAVGGALGYSWRHFGSTRNPGVTGGVLGVGLDEWGNFATYVDGFYRDVYGTGGIGRSPGITIRGPGNLDDVGGFQYLTHADATIETGSRAGVKTVEITITPAPTQHLTVKLDGVTLINNYDISGHSMPATLKMGFSASTGGSTNYHEIRDLKVSGAKPSTTVLTTVPDPSAIGTNACFRATVTGDDGGDPEGIVKFYNGTTYLGEATIVAGVAEFCYNSLALGNHTINAEYQGDSTYASSTDDDSHEVVDTAPEIDVQRPASIPDGGTDGLGNTPAGLTMLTYIIDNTAGTAQLDVTCGTASNYVNSSDFAVVSALPMHVAAGETGTMQISFNVTVTGPFSFDMDICNNDSNEDPYDITIQGIGIADVNGDGVCDVLDVRLVFAHAAGCSLLSGTSYDLADIDNDGDVDMDDAVIYAEYVIGIRP